MDERWGERCRQVAARVMGERGWNLVDPAGDFLQSIVDALRARYSEPETAPEAAIERAVVRQYCAVLHAACQAQDRARQQRAFDEVRNYLYPHAVYRLHNAETAHDAVQQALAKVWQKLGSCKDPGSFLGWADQVLLNVIRDLYREYYETRLTDRGAEYVPREIGLEQVSKQEERDVLTLDASQNPVALALGAPMRDALIATLRECLENERHVVIIVELFLNDKSFAEVGAALRASPLNVQVMKSRALARLRECPELRQLYREWLN